MADPTPDGPAATPPAGLARRLLSWFDANARDLPWRRDRDPYRVWVSEVMLQQTTVTAAVPYFERFLAAFPTVHALAAADLHDVLRLWEGLGYYSRARNLHRAARTLAADHGGLPDDPAVWRALPGVGPYISGAVLSQAFGRAVPIVEANSQRVLCRLFGQRGDVKSGPVRKWLWRAAAAVVPKRRPGDFNQAVMELGALVCTPADPKCGDCPARRDCVAHRDGLQNVIPYKSPARAPTDVAEAAVVVRDGGRVLLVKRPPDAPRWAEMWEFPHGERRPDESAADAAVRLARELAGLDVRVTGELPAVRHAVTRFRITMECVEAERAGGTFASAFYAEGRWLLPAELADYAVSVPQRRLAKSLAEPVQRKLF